jgi:hypothetical protein
MALETPVYTLLKALSLSIITVFARGSGKKGEFRTFAQNRFRPRISKKRGLPHIYVLSLEKSKKVDLCGQEGINPVEGCEGRLS